ncbi:MULTISPECIES: flagellar basal body rod protein FlgB [unclassified Sporolactobacillus]|uniref:flagellar basal body rod protein FlgB n=1 Tax=unclassified Sporolactobacillus TaxID=2628533 RepID=UPI0023675D34|nr:flagellar basal body rod protein FlgB [Sporolactobacillus sp. CQH2019]MDD9147070.1 flagellar basal body rod protein FlgB [Sporolactobacillus sp. CQH2019]
MFSLTPLSAIERAMNGSMAEQNAISQNIANVDTPNYKAQKVVFNDVLNQSMQTNQNNSDNFPLTSADQTGYSTVTDTYGTIQNNGNNVDIDHEMSDLAQNQLYYQALGQAASNQFQQFNTVLGG